MDAAIDWQAFLQALPGKVWWFVQAYGPAVLQAIVIYIVGKWVARILRGIFRRVLLKSRVDPTLTNFVVNVAYAVLVVFVIIAAVDKLGVQTTSFVALLGAAGLAVGFALQGSLSNFASGVMIILFRPFKLGDFVEAGGASGVIESIDMLVTVLTTADNKKIIVPNSTMMGGKIVNYSAHPTRRVDMVFGIGYDDDLQKAKKILETILANHPLVLKDPAPAVALGELADSSVNFNVRPWVKTEDYWTVYSEIHETVKLEFDKLNISIPFPQRDVHMHQVA